MDVSVQMLSFTSFILTSTEADSSLHYSDDNKG